LRVLDNGRGITAAPSGGNGVRNITERAARLGGRCALTVRPEGGTALEWVVPATR
jgi:signal transduction histidine kinase